MVAGPAETGDHIALAEAMEAIRRHVLTMSPSSAARIADRQNRHWQHITPRERATLAIACALDWNPELPSIRRSARALLAEHQESDPGGPAHLVREVTTPPPDIPPSRREEIAMLSRALSENSFWEKLAECSGAVSALRLVTRSLPALSGQRAVRFLLQIGYPMIHVDQPRRRWLHRFGLLASLQPGRDGTNEALRAFGQLVEATGVGLPELDLLLGLFTGAESAEEIDVALCTKRPHCSRCPVLAHCEYGRARAKFETLGESPAARTNRLADAMPASEMPREKLLQKGPESLGDAELLAILLRTGTGGENAVELAQRILREAGPLEKLAHRSIAELSRIKGLGAVKAITIRAALEMARRVSSSPSRAEEAVTSARTVFERFRSHFLNRQKEYFVCLLLNTKNRIIGEVVVSEGTLNQSLVHPREAFQAAIRDAANAVIFVHNHPSGDPAPSREDQRITQRLVQAGEVVGVRVLDHVIIGRDTYYSFADAGQLNG